MLEQAQLPVFKTTVVSWTKNQAGNQTVFSSEHGFYQLNKRFPQSVVSKWALKLRGANGLKH